MLLLPNAPELPGTLLNGEVAIEITKMEVIKAGNGVGLRFFSGSKMYYLLLEDDSTISLKIFNA